MIAGGASEEGYRRRARQPTLCFMRIPFAQILAHAMRLLFAAALLGLAPPHAAHGATVYNVPASIAGNCSADVTAPLLGWIASVPDNSGPLVHERRLLPN